MIEMPLLVVRISSLLVDRMQALQGPNLQLQLSKECKQKLYTMVGPGCEAGLLCIQVSAPLETVNLIRVTLN